MGLPILSLWNLLFQALIDDKQVSEKLEREKKNVVFDTTSNSKRVSCKIPCQKFFQIESEEML